MNDDFWPIQLVAAVAIAGLSLAACKQEVPAPVAEVAPQAVAPALAPGSVVVEVLATEDRMLVTNSGEKSDGKVRSTGVGGALIFGPYMPLMVGEYSLLVEGASDGPFSVDVVHSAGSKQIAAQDYPAQVGNAVGSGSLSVLDFEVVEPIETAEFRVIVPAGADTEIHSYKVVAR